MKTKFIVLLISVSILAPLTVFMVSSINNKDEVVDTIQEEEINTNEEQLSPKEDVVQHIEFDEDEDLDDASEDLQKQREEGIKIAEETFGENRREYKEPTPKNDNTSSNKNENEEKKRENPKPSFTGDTEISIDLSDGEDVTDIVWN